MDTAIRFGPSVHGTLRTNPAECMKRRRSLQYAGLHPRTIRAYRTALDRFLKYVPSRALPASWALVEALMGVAFDRRLPLLALLLALGFNCLLRTSEMLSITHRHVVVHENRRALSVIIPGSKTSQGNPQVLLVQDLALVHLAMQLQEPRSRALLWSRGPYHFREQFAELLVQLGFQGLDYTPYCLRRGGATWFFQSSLSMDATVARGRWSCSRTARSYVDEDTMQLAQTHWSKHQGQKVRHWRRRCKAFRPRQ